MCAFRSSSPVVTRRPLADHSHVEAPHRFPLVNCAGSRSAAAASADAADGFARPLLGD